MRVSAWRRASIQTAALLVTFGCIMAGGGGCTHEDTTPTAAAANDMTMPAEKQKAIMAADAMVSNGQKEIDQGQDLKDKDPSQSAQLIKQGEADKARGESMLNDAYQMR